jgi:hypothetical protein
VKGSRSLAAALALGLALLPASVLRAEGPFDGSKPLICTADDTVECSDAHDTCLPGDAEDLDLAALFRLDFAAKRLEALGAGREGQSAPIEQVRREGGRLVLQGGRGGRAFTLLIDETTGESTATVTDVGAAFVLFGACAAP